MATDALIRRSGVVFEINVQATEIETTGSTTGTFIYGETVTGGTSSATGKLVFDDDTNDFMYLRDVTGTFSNTETLTGGTSGATVTTGTVSAATAYFTSYQTIGRAKTSIQLNQSRNVQQVTDFETAEDDFFDVITDGKQGNVSWTSNLVPTNIGYAVANQAFEGNLTVKVKITPTSIDGTAYEAELFEGFFDNVSRTYNESGVSEAQFSMAISGIPAS